MIDVFFFHAPLFALLFASIALAICMTSAELHLHNLASGAVVVLGGWIAAELLPSTTAHQTTTWWLLPIVGAITALAALPLFAKDSLRQHPLLYLLASLGVALVVSSIAQGFYLPSSSATLAPFDSRGAQLALALLGTFATVIVSCIVFQSKRWHQLVIEWRVSDDPSVWKGAAILVIVQHALLLCIGACFTAAHRGLVGAAEYKTILAILAVFAVRFRPVQAAILAGSVGAGILVIDASGTCLGGWSEPIAAVVVASIVVYRFRQRLPLITARRVVPVVARRTTRGAILLAGGAFLFTLLGAITQAYKDGWGSVHVHQAAALVVLVVVAWVTYRILGVLTIAWPMITGIAFYLVCHLETEPVLLLVCLVTFVVACAAYLYFLRILPETASLVIDLSIVLILHHVIMTSEIISGAHNMLIAAYPSALALSSRNAAIVQGVTAALPILLLIGLGSHGALRARILSVANFSAGARHGQRPISTFLVIACIVVAMSVLSTFVYHTQKDSISPAEVAVIRGLEVLLFAYIGAELRLMWAFVLLMLVYCLQISLGLGQGIVEEVVAGTLFIAATYAAVVVARRGNA